MNIKDFWKIITTEHHPARSRDNFLFWFASLLYMEILFHTMLFGGFDSAFLYMLGFTLVIALVISGLLGLLPDRANLIVSCVLMGIISLIFFSQMVYSTMHGTLYSLPPVRQEAATSDGPAQVIKLLLTVMVLAPIPVSIMLAVRQPRLFWVTSNIYRPLTVIVALLVYYIISQCLVIGGTGSNSAYYFYHNVGASTEQAAQRFGLLTTMGLDLFSGQDAADPPPAETTAPETTPVETTEETIPVETTPVQTQPTEPDMEYTDSGKIPLKIQILGDSMSDSTWGDKHTWVDMLEDYLPEYELTIVNNAIGGNTLMQITTLDGDTMGISYQITSGDTPLSEDADLIIVWAGSNDWTNSPELGTLRNGDGTTFYGSVQSVIETLQDQTSAQLLFITPLQRNSESDQRTRPDRDIYGNRLNQGCATLEQYAEAIMQTCAYYGVPCLDLYHTSGINQDNIHKYAADGLHLDFKAEKIIAKKIAEAIRNPGMGTSRSSTPAYDLSVLTDVYHDRLCETIVVDGTKIFLNWDFDGIKTAFSNGNVTLRYKIEIYGTELTVSSTGTAAYAQEDDHWTFVSYLEHGDTLIRVTIVFKEYGLEATAVSVG